MPIGNKELTRDLLVETLDDHELAIRQIEDERKAMSDYIDKKLKLSRMQYGDGSYRGIFESEGQATAAGYFVLSITHPNEDLRVQAREAIGRDGYFHQRDMSTTDSSSGGALVPIEFSNRIKRLVEEHAIFPKWAFNHPMGSDQTVFLKQVGEVTVFLLTEGLSGTDSEPGWERVLLQSKEWGTLCFYPRNLDEDSVADVAEQVFRSFAWAFGYKIDNIAFNGDGSSTYFGIQGIIPKLKSINGVDDGGGLVLGSGNTWGELTLADHENVQAQLPDYPGMQPRWFCSRKYYYNVMVRLMLSGGGVTAGEIAAMGTNKMFLGDPVTIVNVMPKVEGNSQIPCLYGDMSLAATFGLRRQMTMEQSKEYKFAERQVTCLGTMRPAISIEDLGSDTEAGPMIGLITASS